MTDECPKCGHIKYSEINELKDENRRLKEQLESCNYAQEIRAAEIRKLRRELDWYKSQIVPMGTTE